MSRFVIDPVEPTEGKGKDRASSFSESHSDVDDTNEATSIIDISDSECGDSEKDADEGSSQEISYGEGASHVAYIYID